MTEGLITAGFKKSLISHGNSNADNHTLFEHLDDRLSAINFVFDFVKDERILSVSFMKELHQLVTRHQKHVSIVDQFRQPMKKQFIKGEFKKTEDNPSRERN